MTKLNDLAAFLEKNSASAAASSSAAAGMVSAAHMDPQAGSMLHQQKSMQDALLRERQSMLFLQQLVSHCLQVLGLWRVVSDHQFHTVAASLSLDDQNMLRGMYFRDLIISTSGKGRYLYDVRKFFGFFHPLPPDMYIIHKASVLLSAFWGPPPPTPSADVI